MRDLARPVTLALLGAIALVSLWTPLAHRRRRGALVRAAEPVLLRAGAGAGAARHLGDPAHAAPATAHAAPFLLALLLLFLGYSGLGISLWPNIIPPAISIWDAAAPPQSMGFTLVGALFIIPFILAYTAWSYYVFRGKVKAGEGYH